MCFNIEPFIKSSILRDTDVHPYPDPLACIFDPTEDVLDGVRYISANLSDTHYSIVVYLNADVYCDMVSEYPLLGVGKGCGVGPFKIQILGGPGYGKCGGERMVLASKDGGWDNQWSMVEGLSDNRELSNDDNFMRSKVLCKDRILNNHDKGLDNDNRELNNDNRALSSKVLCKDRVLNNHDKGLDNDNKALCRDNRELSNDNFMRSKVLCKDRVLNNHDKGLDNDNFMSSKALCKDRALSKDDGELSRKALSKDDGELSRKALSKDDRVLSFKALSKDNILNCDNKINTFPMISFYKNRFIMVIEDFNFYGDTNINEYPINVNHDKDVKALIENIQVGMNLKYVPSNNLINMMEMDVERKEQMKVYLDEIDGIDECFGDDENRENLKYNEIDGLDEYFSDHNKIIDDHENIILENASITLIDIKKSRDKMILAEYNNTNKDDKILVENKSDENIENICGENEGMIPFDFNRSQSEKTILKDRKYHENEDIASINGSQSENNILKDNKYLENEDIASINGSQSENTILKDNKYHENEDIASINGSQCENTILKDRKYHENEDIASINGSQSENTILKDRKYHENEDIASINGSQCENTILKDRKYLENKDIASINNNEGLHKHCTIDSKSISVVNIEKNKNTIYNHNSQTNKNINTEVIHNTFTNPNIIRNKSNIKKQENEQIIADKNIIRNKNAQKKHETIIHKHNYTSKVNTKQNYRIRKYDPSNLYKEIHDLSINRSIYQQTKNKRRTMKVSINRMKMKNKVSKCKNGNSGPVVAKCVNNGNVSFSSLESIERMDVSDICQTPKKTKNGGVQKYVCENGSSQCFGNYEGLRNKASLESEKNKFDGSKGFQKYSSSLEKKDDIGNLWLHSKLNNCKLSFVRDNQCSLDNKESYFENKNNHDSLDNNEPYFTDQDNIRRRLDNNEPYFENKDNTIKSKLNKNESDFENKDKTRGKLNKNESYFTDQDKTRGKLNKNESDFIDQDNTRSSLDNNKSWFNFTNSNDKISKNNTFKTLKEIRLDLQNKLNSKKDEHKRIKLKLDLFKNNKYINYDKNTSEFGDNNAEDYFDMKNNEDITTNTSEFRDNNAEDYFGIENNKDVNSNTSEFRDKENNEDITINTSEFRDNNAEDYFDMKNNEDITSNTSEFRDNEDIKYKNLSKRELKKQNKLLLSTKKLMIKAKKIYKKSLKLHEIAKKNMYKQKTNYSCNNNNESEIKEKYGIDHANSQNKDEHVYNNNFVHESNANKYSTYKNSISSVENKVFDKLQEENEFVLGSSQIRKCAIDDQNWIQYEHETNSNSALNDQHGIEQDSLIKRKKKSGFKILKCILLDSKNNRGVYNPKKIIILNFIWSCFLELYRYSNTKFTFGQYKNNILIDLKAK